MVNIEDMLLILTILGYAAASSIMYGKGMGYHSSEREEEIHY